jgi:hypothetical protein
MAPRLPFSCGIFEIADPQQTAFAVQLASLRMKCPQETLNL